MPHLQGVCGKHQHLRRPVTDCDDCKRAQRRAMQNTVSRQSGV